MMMENAYVFTTKNTQNEKVNECNILKQVTYSKLVSDTSYNKLISKQTKNTIYTPTFAQEMLLSIPYTL